MIQGINWFQGDTTEAEKQSVKLQVEQEAAAQDNQELQNAPLLDPEPDFSQENNPTEEINQRPDKNIQ